MMIVGVLDFSASFSTRDKLNEEPTSPFAANKQKLFMVRLSEIM